MLRIASSSDGLTYTVYSEKLAIGGLVAERPGSWRWAIFCLHPRPLDASEEFAPIGGTARSHSEAFEALQRRWSAWLDAAGLSRSAIVHTPVQRSLDEITLNAPLCRRDGVTHARQRRLRRIASALRR